MEEMSIYWSSYIVRSQTGKTEEENRWIRMWKPTIKGLEHQVEREKWCGQCNIQFRLLEREEERSTED